jgi:hypothetical protein
MCLATLRVHHYGGSLFDLYREPDFEFFHQNMKFIDARAKFRDTKPTAPSTCGPTLDSLPPHQRSPIF